MFSRREMIKGIGKAICAGLAVPFIPKLLPEQNTMISIKIGDTVIGEGVEVAVGGWFDAKTFKELKVDTYKLNHPLGEFEVSRPIVSDDQLDEALKGMVWASL